MNRLRHLLRLTSPQHLTSGSWGPKANVMLWSVLVGTPLVLRLWILWLPYWYDEALTMHYVRQNFGRMLQLVFSDLHVPLYYMVMYVWIRFFGDSQMVTGAFSFLIG